MKTRTRVVISALAAGFALTCSPILSAPAAAAVFVPTFPSGEVTGNGSGDNPWLVGQTGGVYEFYTQLGFPLPAGTYDPPTVSGYSYSVNSGGFLSVTLPLWADATVLSGGNIINPTQFGGETYNLNGVSSFSVTLANLLDTNGDPGSAFPVQLSFSGTPTQLVITPSFVPLPAALPMFGAALIGLGGIARRRTKKAA
jgi:hypothetical protein